MSDVNVFISDDYYKAFISVDFTDDAPVEVDDIIKLLTDGRVTYGTDIEVITAICAMKESVVNELVAEGQPHIHGINSEITLTYEDKKFPRPKVLEDGSVDFKHLNLLQKVKKGEILATKIPSTEGIHGMTVTGKEVRSRNGKDLKFSIGENVSISENGLRLYATCDGIYKCKNHKISVLNYLEFPDGVGVQTGNIDFKGDIFITGNVINGYKIDCDGNLTITGLIEGTDLNVTGDITITKGISGRCESTVICGGNFISKYIDNADIRVKGNLETGEILNSKVMCDGEVIVKGKKGHIIGGEITAKYAINATTIGSKLGVITLINLGVDIDSIEELKELKSFISNEMETERKLKQFINILEGKVKKEMITSDEKENLERCYDSLEQIQFVIKEKTARLKTLREVLLKAQQGQVKTETIYPDTLVRIGRQSYFVDEAVLRSIIKRSHDDIVAIGF